MANIHLLDAQTANLIAAGEVVERPANVLKELLENAIDAKSTSIVTEIQGGGVDFIRVTDNGCGIAKEDLPLAIRRHATSKIRSSQDLDAISTLGFRGEALAAISSTSRFTMLSKRKEDAIGHQLTAEGEDLPEVEEAGCADGTTILVRDLFFNQPARRKFLKRAQTEASAILQYIQRIAVSHPEISFKHTSDGVVKLQTVGNGKLSDCIYSVYGNEFFSSLTPLEYEKNGIRLYGFITRPEMARSNHSYQSFYINSRFVKSRTMQFAMEDAYKSFVKSEKFPGCVLFLEIDPSQVDVNVHPAKLEVRFAEEKLIYDAVYQAVRQTLLSLSNRLAKDLYESALEKSKTDAPVSIPVIHETKPKINISFEVKNGSYQETSEELPLFSAAPSRGKSIYVPKEEKTEPKTVEVTAADFFTNPPPTASTSLREETLEQTIEQKLNFRDERLIANEIPLSQPIQLSLDGNEEQEKKDNPLLEEGTIRGVIFHAFILYETATHLYLIDKHAAHERILYESLKKNHASGGVQMFIEPVFLSFSTAEAAVLGEYEKEMENAGFLLEEFGENSFLLRGIPMEFTSLGAEDLKLLLQKAAAELQIGGRAGGAGEKLFDRTLYSMACKAAVKAGIPSTGSDHEWIVEQIRTIDNITVCPHGRPILVPFTKKQIENLFLRT